MTRVTLLAFMSVLVLVACQGGASSTKSTFLTTTQKHPLYAIIEQPAESPYEAALGTALAASMLPDAMNQVCTQWYPEIGHAVAKAYVEWRARNLSVLDDLRQRSTSVWMRRAGDDATYVDLVYPHLRREMIKDLMLQSDAMTVEEFKSSCTSFPTDVKGERWDLENRLVQELTVIRGSVPGRS